MTPSPESLKRARVLQVIGVGFAAAWLAATAGAIGLAVGRLLGYGSWLWALGALAGGWVCKALAREYRALAARRVQDG
jgi:hypothetical protein